MGQRLTGHLASRAAASASCTAASSWLSSCASSPPTSVATLLHGGRRHGTKELFARSRQRVTGCQLPSAEPRGAWRVSCAWQGCGAAQPADRAGPRHAAPHPTPTHTTSANNNNSESTAHTAQHGSEAPPDLARHPAQLLPAAVSGGTQRFGHVQQLLHSVERARAQVPGVRRRGKKGMHATTDPGPMAAA